MLKIGYNLIVDSWENDLDARKGVVMHFDCLEEAKALKDALEELEKRNLTNRLYGEPSNEVYKVGEKYGFDYYEFSDKLYQAGLTSEFFSLRVVDSVQLIHVKVLDYEVLG